MNPRPQIPRTQHQKFRRNGIVLLLWWGLEMTLVACEPPRVQLIETPPAKGRRILLESGNPVGDTGWWPSLAVDSNDQPHLSYCDAYRGDLVYATRDNSGDWQRQIVLAEGAVGKYTAIGVAGDGSVGIAFYDQDQRFLRYAFTAPTNQRRHLNDSTNASQAAPPLTWEIERIAWGLEVGMGAELRFDTQNRGNLFYYTSSGKLVHARRELDGDWRKVVISEATGGFSVRISVMERPDGYWLSYVDWDFKETALYLARPVDRDAMTYASELVASRHGPGWRSELFFDDQTPFILYALNYKRELRMAKRNGKGDNDDSRAAWTTSIIASDVGNFAASMVPGGDLVIVYEEVRDKRAFGGVLSSIQRNPGDNSWRKYLLDGEIGTGSHLDVATNRAGGVVVAYYAASAKGIKIHEQDAPKTP